MTKPSKASPFNLPPPWSSGYAYPQNVIDEGLERHAYVTEQTPSGTYDNPTLYGGSGNYATPQYIVDEQYGQGAAVTRWAQRGSYPGARIKHWLDHASSKMVASARLPGGITKLSMQAMSDYETAATGEAAFSEYGTRIANMLINTVQGLPVSHRVKFMRQVMDRIDPTLYARAELAAQPELKAGATPTVALARGIAHAASHGMARELVALGRGKRPSPRTALGEVMSDLGALSAAQIAAAKTAGAASRAKYGVGAGSAHVVAAGTATQPTKTTLTAGSRQIKVGPFMFPYQAIGNTGASQTVKWTQQLPADWQADIIKVLSTDCHPCITSSMIPATPGHKIYALSNFIPQLPTSVNRDFVAVGSNGGNGVAVSQMRPQGLINTPSKQNPIIRSKHPVTGEDYGLYLAITAPNPTGTWNESTNLPYIELTWAPIVTSWVQYLNLWNDLKFVTAELIDGVEAAAKWVAAAGCALMSSALGPVAGAAAGAAVGGASGAQAGKMGAMLAGGACGSPLTCQPGLMPDPTGKVCVPIPPQSSVLMPMLLIGGAGLAVVLLMKKKKKQPRPSAAPTAATRKP